MNPNRTTTATTNITFVYGAVVSFNMLPENSIALDGYVQGPQHEPETRRYSLDHHAGCLRSVTLATCQQALTLLQLGLPIDADTKLFCNDWDADTVLAAWLIQRVRAGEAEIVHIADVIDLVNRVGLTDAHGPLFKPHALHWALGPKRGEAQTPEMVERFFELLDRWYDTGEAPKVAPARPGRGYGLRAGSATWEPITTTDGFGPVYEAGYVAAALCEPAAEGSLTWVVGKRSDLVPLALGPADGSKDRSGSYTSALLGRLAHAEAILGCPSTENWGGGSSIGGSPRRAGGVGSRLPEARVVAILNGEAPEEDCGISGPCGYHGTSHE